jgi:hypothetical protein
MLDTASSAIAAAFGMVSKGFKGLAARRGVVPTGAEGYLQRDLLAASKGEGPALSRQVLRAHQRRRNKLAERAGTIYMRAMKRFPGDSAKAQAKRKTFADMLTATGAQRKAYRGALGLF